MLILSTGEVTSDVLHVERGYPPGLHDDLEQLAQVNQTMLGKFCLRFSIR